MAGGTSHHPLTLPRCLPFDPGATAPLATIRARAARAEFTLDIPELARLSLAGRDLILRLITPSPATRLTIGEVLAHPWLGTAHPSRLSLDVGGSPPGSVFVTTASSTAALPPSPPPASPSPLPPIRHPNSIQLPLELPVSYLKLRRARWSKMRATLQRFDFGVLGSVSVFQGEEEEEEVVVVAGPPAARGSTTTATATTITVSEPDALLLAARRSSVGMRGGGTTGEEGGTPPVPPPPTTHSEGGATGKTHVQFFLSSQ